MHIMVIYFIKKNKQKYISKEIKNGMHKTGLHFLSKVYHLNQFQWWMQWMILYFHFFSLLLLFMNGRTGTLQWSSEGWGVRQTGQSWIMDGGHDMALYFSRQRYLVKTSGYFSLFFYFYFFQGQTYDLPCLCSSECKLHPQPRLYKFGCLWPLSRSTNTGVNLEKWLNRVVMKNAWCKGWCKTRARCTSI